LKMLKVTGSYEGDPIYINPARIVCMHRDGNKTRIVMGSEEGDAVLVVDSVEQVLTQLKAIT